MSFRIDLAFKDNVHIYLVVVRDQININFMPNDFADFDAPFTLRYNFEHLLSHINLDNRARMVKGNLGAHVKRHHVYHEETHIPHLHTTLNQDVTPEILKQYLEEILEAQEYHEEYGDLYQFFKQSTIDDTINAFGQYYRKYMGTSVQQHFLEERQLTQIEKESLLRDPHKESLNSRDKEELKKCGLDVAPASHIQQKSQNSIISFFQFLFFKIGLNDDSNSPSVKDTIKYFK